MEDAVFVHVIDRLKHLVHEVLDPILRQVVSSALDRLVHIHIHQFKDQGESTGWFIAIIRQLRSLYQMQKKKEQSLKVRSLTRALHGA